MQKLYSQKTSSIEKGVDVGAIVGMGADVGLGMEASVAATAAWIRAFGSGVGGAGGVVSQAAKANETERASDIAHKKGRYFFADALRVAIDVTP